MRTIDEILADMQAIVAKPSLTADDVIAYGELEAELAAAQAANTAAPAEGEGDDPEDTVDEVPVVEATATTRAAAALRQRHAQYTRVVVPAGRPSNAARTQAETEMDGFRAYLRTGRPNNDMTRSNAQTTGTGSSGGYTVPEDFRNRIVEVIKSFGGVLADVETLTTTDGRPLPFPTINDTANSAVIAAENTAPASAGADLVFGEVNLGAFEYNATGAGNTPLALPRALVQDSAVNIEDLVARQLGLRLRRKMAVDAISGDGSGDPQGILQGITGLEIVGTTLEYSDLVDLVMSLDAAYWANAKFYCNQAALGVVSQIEDTNGNLIFKQGVTITDGSSTRVFPALAIGPLLVPVVPDNDMPALTLSAGAGINWGIFGDIREGYIWRQVKDVEVLVDPYSANDKRQIKYNAWVRADGKQKNTTAYKVIAGHTT